VLLEGREIEEMTHLQFRKRSNSVYRKINFLDRNKKKENLLSTAPTSFRTSLLMYSKKSAGVTAEEIWGAHSWKKGGK